MSSFTKTSDIKLKRFPCSRSFSNKLMKRLLITFIFFFTMALDRYISLTRKHFLGLLIMRDFPQIYKKKDSKNFARNALLRTYLATVSGFTLNCDIQPEISKKHFVRIEGHQFPRQLPSYALINYEYYINICNCANTY